MMTEYVSIFYTCFDPGVFTEDVSNSAETFKLNSLSEEVKQKLSVRQTPAERAC